jgi:FAD/FMN-containing dehydrogenase
MALSAAARRELDRILGPRGVVDGAVASLAYESDGLALIRGTPEIVLLPRDTAQCAAALGVLAAEDVPVVGRGAGTGLSGGATPVSGGALVGMARMRDVLELNLQDRFARVQAGMVNVDLTNLCAKHGLFYAPDPSSQQACTIGGNVGENSGGPHCFKYGATARHVLGLVIVTADGQVLDLSQPRLEPDGYDLVGLFVGSEGTFGLATEITVRLTRKPAAVETLLAVFGDLDGACDATSDLIAERLEPSAIEILDRLTIEAVEQSVFRAGYPRGAGAVLLVEVEGSETEVATTVRDVTRIARARGASRCAARAARASAKTVGRTQGRLRSHGTHRSGPLRGRRVRAAHAAQGTGARRHAHRGREAAQALQRVPRRRRQPAPNISYDRRNPDEVERVLAAGREIMELCVAAGGSLTGEHGVGLEKREEMCLVYGDDDLAVMRRVREAWDPARRMNPGKLLPVRACREARGASLPRRAAPDHALQAHGGSGR